MKQIEVQILGQVYMLGCPDGGENSLRQAVALVDREMTGIRDAGKVKARERMAVLAALNLAYQLTEHAGRTSAPVLPPTPDAASEDGAAGEIDALVSRIDAALNEDGQLL